MRWLVLGILLVGLFACSEKNEEETSHETQTNEIRIYTKNGIGWEKKSKCKIVYQGKKFKGKVKFRGGVSSKYDKHSMTLELKKGRSLGGLPKNDDWILNASYIDKTFQRHKLSYDLFRAMNPANRAAQCAYVPVYLNDHYQGVYVLMEKINGPWLGLSREAFGEDRLFKDPFIFVEEHLDNVQEPENYYQQKYPRNKYVEAYAIELDGVRDLLFQIKDSDALAKILDSHWFDLRNVMDWQLLLMLTNNDDGLYKNFYMFRTMDSKYQFIPWDYDHSFGRDGDYALNLMDHELGWDRMVLFRHLMQSESIGYKEQLKARWLELRKTVFTEDYIFGLMEENEKAIRPYLKENAKRWPLDAKWYSDGNDFDKEIGIIKQFVPMRLKQLDDFFNTL